MLKCSEYKAIYNIAFSNLCISYIKGTNALKILLKDAINNQN